MTFYKRFLHAWKMDEADHVPGGKRILTAPLGGLNKSVVDLQSPTVPVEKSKSKEENENEQENENEKSTDELKDQRKKLKADYNQLKRSI